MAFNATLCSDRTTLRLLQGHVYGLIGRNGVGKSTLLRKIHSGTLPGFPPHLKVAQVMQVSEEVRGRAFLDCLIGREDEQEQEEQWQREEVM